MELPPAPASPDVAQQLHGLKVSEETQQLPPPPTPVKIFVSTKGLALKIGELEKVRICSFLSPTDLLRLSETCKSFYAASTVGDVWLKFCVSLWADRTMNSPHGIESKLPAATATASAGGGASAKPPILKMLPPSSPAHIRTLMRRIKTLPISAVTRALTRVDCSLATEKPEYQALLRSFLLFGLRREHTPTGLKVRYPAWCHKLDDCKATYFHSIRKELRRKTLTQAELCAVNWLFHFKHEMEGEDDTIRAGVQAKFFNDNTMTSQMHGQMMTWGWVEAGGGRMCVQVEQYPPLTISLLPTGAWRMENHYVYFEQPVTLSLDEISLIC